MKTTQLLRFSLIGVPILILVWFVWALVERLPGEFTTKAGKIGVEVQVSMGDRFQGADDIVILMWDENWTVQIQDEDVIGHRRHPESLQISHWSFERNARKWYESQLCTIRFYPKNDKTNPAKLRRDILHGRVQIVRIRRW